MAEDKHPYKRVTPDEIVAEVVQRVPELERDAARQLQQSLQEQWEPLRERYEVARLLAKWLLYTFFFVVVWSGVMMMALLILSAITSNIGREEIDIVTDFVKDLLPYIATPLGVALGFYFREVYHEAS